MMKKILASITMSLMCMLPSLAQAELDEFSLLDKKVVMLVPGGITPLNTNLFESHSPWYDARTQMGGKEQGNKVILAFHYSDSLVDDNGIPGFTDQLLAQANALQKMITLKDDGIILQDGKNIGYIKFISGNKNQKYFTYLFYLSVDNRLLLFSFTCPKKLMKKWDAAVRAMAASIRVQP
jgi:hypothetical protein